MGSYSVNVVIRDFLATALAFCQFLMLYNLEWPLFFVQFLLHYYCKKMNVQMLWFTLGFLL